MSRRHLSDTEKIFLQLNEPLRFRLSRTKETEDFFPAESSDRTKMSKKLNNYIALLFSQVQALVFCFSHLLLSLVHLLG